MLVDGCVNSREQCATEILGLPLPDADYDVAFVWDSFDAAYRDAAPLFLGDPGAALVAAELLVDVLNQFPGIVGIVAQPSDRLPFSTASIIPVEVRSSDVVGYAARTHEILMSPFQLSFGPAALTKSEVLQGSFNTWAVFTPSGNSVPEPRYLALLFLSILALIFFRDHHSRRSAEPHSASGFRRTLSNI